jgi:hypothetical protein
MQKFVAEQNIQHFRERLARETDPHQRELLQRMIDEEEAKLQAYRRPRAAE